jgi:hypothetical protein
MKKQSETDISTSNNGEVNRVFEHIEAKPDEPENLKKPPPKSGGWFAKPPVRPGYIPPAPTFYPLKTSKDYHQTWPIDTANGEGLVYTIEVTHPDQNEAKTYVVHPEVVMEAARRCYGGDYTYSILTDKNSELGGEVRTQELHPWVTKTGQFGLMPVRCPIIGNTLSEEAYEAKRSKIDAYQNQWVRRTTIARRPEIQVLPPGAQFDPPRWPKVLVDGDWEAIITRAYDNRYIRSLDDKVARNLAGLD